MQAVLQYTLVLTPYMPDEKQKPPNIFLRAFLFKIAQLIF
jgi:hypothetical protein